jgi:hypothetical protein
MGKGIDVRATSGELIFRALLQDSAGAIVTSGTTSLRLYELDMADGSVKSYDFNDHTFKAGLCTTETAAMTHRTGNNGGTNTGIWTYRLATLTGFTKGNIYFSHITNIGASPAVQVREWQFGSEQGDAATLGTDNKVLLSADAQAGVTIPAVTTLTNAVSLTSGERTTLAGVIWATLTSALTTVGSIGKRIADYLDAAISTRATPADISGITVQASVAVSEAVANSVARGHLAIESYHTVRQAITSTVTADLSTASKVWLAIKNDVLDSDDASIAYVEESAGLTRVDGENYVSTTNGSLTVSGSSGAWEITFYLHASVAGLLEKYIGSSKPAQIKALIGGDNIDVWTDLCDFSSGLIKSIS